jgi:hypothetical protein
MTTTSGPRPWSGRAVTNARHYMAQLLPLPCGRCGHRVTPEHQWVIGHRIPRSVRPDLTWDPTNWQPEHRRCPSAPTLHASSEGSGLLVRVEKRKRDALQRIAVSRGAGVGPYSTSAAVSLPDPTDWAEVAGSLPWLGELAAIPADATPPRYMTGRHPDAVGTFGPEFVAWLDAHPGIHPRRSDGLRWWQRMVAYRLLEHDAAGTLVWRNALVTMARQVGKSWLVRAFILWRQTQGERFGEEQTIIHIAHRLTTAAEVWRPAARWAVGQGWRVRWANGEQVIESPDGGRWLIQAATDGVGVGFALSMLAVDEGWQIRRAVVEAADPALVEAVSPQLLLISTAGDSASDLFGTYRAGALATLDDPANTLLVEWSAAPDARLDDPQAWRDASPSWSDRRESEVIDKLGKLEELEFRQNFLNQWVDAAHGRPAEPGVPAFGDAEWDALATFVPSGPPAAAAVESWWGQGVAVAFASHGGDGRVGVRVVTVDTPADAATILAGVPYVLAGKSVAADPAFASLVVRPVGATSRQAVGELRRMVADGVLTHDGGEDLRRQVLGVRIVAGPDGPRVRSTTRLDALKSAVWAAREAREAPEAPEVF